MVKFRVSDAEPAADNSEIERGWFPDRLLMVKFLRFKFLIRDVSQIGLDMAIHS